MKVGSTERGFIRTTLGFAESIGYGNLIAHLQTAWMKKLIQSGLDAETARKAVTNLVPYPIKMHEDIVDRGMWDESGQRYMTGEGE